MAKSASSRRISDLPPNKSNENNKSPIHQAALSRQMPQHEQRQQYVDLRTEGRHLPRSNYENIHCPPLLYSSKNSLVAPNVQQGSASHALAGNDPREGITNRLPVPAKDRADSFPQQREIWIAGFGVKRAYNFLPLVNSQPVLELWDDTGDTHVHLFPKSMKNAASFKVRSTIFNSSSRLVGLAGRMQSPRLTNKALDREVGSRSASSCSDTESPWCHDGHGHTPSSSADTHSLYLPCKFVGSGPHSSASLYDADFDELVGTRNLFAFLIGQSILCTKQRPTLLSAFLQIADLLEMYNFTNHDGSTFGQVAASSFETYVTELGLADIRKSRDKTIVALILGERMRCVSLFNEAFTHAVGLYGALRQTFKCQSLAMDFDHVSQSTKFRLERAAMDLDIRKGNVSSCLAGFEFPSAFAGVMSSKTTSERKHVDFDAWKNEFLSMRRHVLAFYKRLYGSWPPKATHANGMETPGLNRLVLKSLYDDFSNLYDLWVDRTAFTSRKQKIQNLDRQSPSHRLLRRIFDEFDRSMPRSQPPVPFDVPNFPIQRERRQDESANFERDTKTWSGRVDHLEIDQLLNRSYNPDSLINSRHSRFIASIRQWECKRARGRTINELCEMRAGAWIFVYAVLQSLPLLVIDAPGIRFHEGVDYFLCQLPPPSVPWTEARRRSDRRSCYQTSDCGGLVSMPCSRLEQGVEGVYQRSHCWKMALEWGQNPQVSAKPDNRALELLKKSGMSAGVHRGFAHDTDSLALSKIPQRVLRRRAISSSSLATLSASDESKNGSTSMQSSQRGSSSSSIFSFDRDSRSSSESSLSSGSGFAGCRAINGEDSFSNSKTLHASPTAIHAEPVRKGRSYNSRWYQTRTRRRSHSSSGLSEHGQGHNLGKPKTTRSPATFDDIIRSMAGGKGTKNTSKGKWRASISGSH